MVAVVCAAVSGCGDGLSGSKYTEENGKDGIEFRSGNKAHVTVMGQTIEADYRVEGDKITLDTKGEAGKLVVTREKDGTITGLPMCGPLKKT
jgi:hypothetical protein